MQNQATRTLLETTRRAAFPLALALTLTANVGFASAGDGYAKKSPSVAQLFEAVVGAEECAPVDEHSCGKTCKMGWNASEKLARMIAKDSESFAVFEPLFREQFAAASTDQHGRERLIGFLAMSGCESSAALGAELYGEAPEAFSEGQVVSFAAMGSKPFKKQVIWRVENDRSESSLPAAYLAFEGNDAGRESLEQASRGELELATVHDALLAAAALDALDTKAGTEAQELNTVLLRVHDRVLADLDRGDLDAARRMALAARVVTKKLEAHANRTYAGGFSLNNLRTDVAWTLRSKAEKLGSAEQVFEVIEEITPIS